MGRRRQGLLRADARPDREGLRPHPGEVRRKGRGPRGLWRGQIRRSPPRGAPEGLRGDPSVAARPGVWAAMYLCHWRGMRAVPGQLREHWRPAVAAAAIAWLVIWGGVRFFRSEE